MFENSNNGNFVDRYEVLYMTANFKRWTRQWNH